MHIVRQTADKLCSLNNISDKETREAYVVQLTTLLANRQTCFSKIFPPADDSDLGDGMSVAMDCHLLSAASHLNMVSVVQQMMTKGIWQERPVYDLTPSTIFGHPAILAASAGNSKVLSALTKDSYLPTNKQRWMHQRGCLATASAEGHVEAVRVLLRRKWNPESTEKEIRQYLVRALRTPSLEIYEMIKTKIDEIDGIPAAERGKKPLGTRSFFKVMFKTCVWEGWKAMAIYFLDFGAPLDSCRENGVQAAFIDSSPLAYACRRGNVAMVRMLLNRGLDTTYAMSYAAAGGNLELVKLLLDDNNDPNEGFPLPIAWAVDLEHEAMFNLLHEQGAEMDLPSARQDVVARARGAGLESMLKLIREKEGIDPYGPAYTTPLPRPRKLCFMCELQTEEEE